LPVGPFERFLSARWPGSEEDQEALAPQVKDVETLMLTDPETPNSR
jgi:hypothetical protein